MNNILYAVYGASGYGREVMPVAREELMEKNISPEKLFFIDDSPQSAVVNGHSVVSFDEFMKMEAAERRVSVAIANSKVREKLAARLKNSSIGDWNLVAKNTVIMDEVDLGEGAILSPFVTITSNVKIGKYFQANIYSYVAHDCEIGDFVTFAPGVKCNGNVTVEDHVYLGTGAIIKQGKPGRPIVIGKGAIVGAGAVVTKNVPEGVTVIGNPAAVLSKENLRRKR